MNVFAVPALDSNYFYVLEQNQKVVLVDPGEADPLFDFLEGHPAFSVEAIWLTHHHGDHIGGSEEIAARFAVPIFGPSYDESRLPFPIRALEAEEILEFQDLKFRVIDLKGHTLGHIGFYCASEGCLFSGDTLFSMGCGRLFEGSPEQMWATLSRIKNLPAHTRVYFSHEYTLKNQEFLESLDDRDSLTAMGVDRLRAHFESRLRTEGKTTPTTVEFEAANNPFLTGNFDQFKRLRALRNLF